MDPGFLAGDKTSCGNAQANEEINIASSDSEVEIVGVQEHARYELFFLGLILFSFYQNVCITKINKEGAGLHFCSCPSMSDAQKAANYALGFFCFAGHGDVRMYYSLESDQFDSY